VRSLQGPSLQQLRRYAIARSLFKPTTLQRAIARLGFGLHYRGLLRVARREAGTRIYEAVEPAPRDDSREARLARAG
jgi:hypothetical protein